MHFQAAQILLTGDYQLLAGDNAFLGLVTTSINHPESIMNPYGQHGCSTGMYSIWNAASNYGGVGIYSPYNAVSQAPPIIFVDSNTAILVTRNSTVRPNLPRIDPDLMIGILAGAYTLNQLAQSQAATTQLITQTLYY